jgi:glutamyl-tRNA synthetase
MPAVVTRFAPSPTGDLHVGGARTALFNYLFAKNQGGRYLLRIEDTDRARSTDSAVDALYRDLDWLGLDHDNAGDVPKQSDRVADYDKLIDELKGRDLAYDAYETPEELDAQRRESAMRRQQYLYKRPAYTEDQLKRFKDEGRVPAVRFKMVVQPWHFDDLVLGPNQGVDAEQVQDFVIRKRDGMPTYHFGVVVDDHWQGITHVLRGKEHLLNTVQHVALMDALGYPRPQFAHLPTILNDTSGAKLSKRDKDNAIRAAAEAWLKDGHTIADLATASGLPVETLDKWFTGKKAKVQLDAADQDRVMRGIDMPATALPEIDVADFRQSGYLPETLLNFLALLGWSPGNDLERMSMPEMIEKFGLDRVGKSDARFDRKKLTAFSTVDFEHAPLDRQLAAFKDYLAVNEPGPLADCDDGQLRQLLKMNAGFHTLREVPEKSAFFFEDAAQIEYDPKAVQKVLLKNDAVGLGNLRADRELLAGLPEWTADAIEAALKDRCEKTGQGLGKVAQPLRVALTGGTVSPPIFDTLAFLPQAEVLKRIDRCLAEVAA